MTNAKPIMPAPPTKTGPRLPQRSEELAGNETEEGIIAIPAQKALEQNPPARSKT